MLIKSKVNNQQQVYGAITGELNESSLKINILTKKKITSLDIFLLTFIKNFQK